MKSFKFVMSNSKELNDNVIKKLKSIDNENYCFEKAFYTYDGKYFYNLYSLKEFESCAYPELTMSEILALEPEPMLIKKPFCRGG